MGLLYEEADIEMISVLPQSLVMGDNIKIKHYTWIRKTYNTLIFHVYGIIKIRVLQEVIATKLEENLEDFDVTKLTLVGIIRRRFNVQFL